jgi:membrane protein implicated in regulation of membrane protease activity
MYTLALESSDKLIILWVAIIVLAAIIETSTMNLTSIWFAGGAFLAMLVAAIFGATTGSIIAQVLVFLVVSASTLIVLRPILTRNLKKNDVKTNADRLIGKIAICSLAITEDSRGEVKIDGKIWTAVAHESIAIGEKVEVLAIEGVKLVVRKPQ